MFSQQQDWHGHVESTWTISFKIKFARKKGLMILDVEFKTRYLWFRSSALFIYTGYFIHPSWWFIINTAMIFCLQTVQFTLFPWFRWWRCVALLSEISPSTPGGPSWDRNRPTGEKGSIPDTQAVPWPVDRGVLNLSHSHLQKTETIMRFPVIRSMEYLWWFHCTNTRFSM